jgi:signal transduction histidine kinase
MLARLESALNEIKQFTADASHELRSPLSFIRTAAELALQNLHADSDSRLAFKQIKDESAKAGCLLGDMLTLARADAGNVNLVFEKIDLLEVVSDVCDKTRLVAQKRHQTINVALNDAAIVPVWGDYSNLHRLLWTILDNAIKYTDESGIITVSFCSTPFNATVTIEDNGIGIRKADLPHIFQRFYRADTSRGEVDGFGLGLSIAKWIADAHKATISVESEENAGSIFKIVFPVSDDSPSLISLENKVSAGQQS